MAAASCLLTEDQFLCSICLDVFTNPVAMPCGHNFCKTCITKNWDINFPLPVSFQRVDSRGSQQQQLEPQCARSEDISCDICAGTKLKAGKSCLVCLASDCKTHLEPHLTVTGLKKHQLINSVENLQGRICVNHDKPLDLFCKNDQLCVCMLCMVSEHRLHDVVPLKKECEEKKAELGKTEAEIQQMIQRRREKILEITDSVEFSNGNANRERAVGLQVFTALKEFVDRGLAELLHTIKEMQIPIETQATSLITELEREISDLMKRNYLHFLQSFTSLNTPPPTKDWTEVRVHPPTYEGTVVRAVAELEETLRKEMNKVFEEELKRVQHNAVDVTLEPDTANPWLTLPDDGKQVKFGDENKNLSDNPKRFSYYASVLGKQSFTSGRFYYEVQVKGKTKWDLGVVRESINRKGPITINPTAGYWTLSLRTNNEYKALSDPRVHLSLKSKPGKVGVFVDYEGGLVSFYDADAAALIYSFIGCPFTERLYPFFNPCNNDGGRNALPLIIYPFHNISTPCILQQSPGC
uniref:Uncharacterized protein n=1 Tax=Monopterus albus TaxID=43700 RepID=A0A3Q3KQW3_MONAL